VSFTRSLHPSRRRLLVAAVAVAALAGCAVARGAWRTTCCALRARSDRHSAGGGVPGQPDLAGRT
jgi:hypothetical protein